jgi:hypothetical protein
MFASGTVFLNATARAQLSGDPLQRHQGLPLYPVRVAGSVRASGALLGVMDVAAAQELFGKLGQLTRIEICACAQELTALHSCAARQFGTIAMEQAGLERLSGDTRMNDMAFWLTADADVSAVHEALHTLVNTLARTPAGSSCATGIWLGFSEPGMAFFKLRKEVVLTRRHVTKKTVLSPWSM